MKEARILAALLHGEIVALAHWLGAQAAAIEKNGLEDRLRSNETGDGLDLSGFSTRAIYESNAWRLDLLGPDLAAAVAYCHVIFERVEWQHIAALSGSNTRIGGDLLAVEAKLRDTASYLEAFAAGQPAA